MTHSVKTSWALCEGVVTGEAEMGQTRPLEALYKL